MENKPTNLDTDKAEFAQGNHQQGTFGAISEPRKSLSSFFRNQNKFEVNAICGI